MAKSRKPSESADLSTLLGSLQAPSPGTPDFNPKPEVATQTAMTSGDEGGLPADMGSGTPADQPQAETPRVLIANMPPDNLVLPGFAMADSPEELDDPQSAAAQRVEPMANAAQPAAPPARFTPSSPIVGRAAEAALEGEIIERPTFTGDVRYESRIRVLEAYQYPGQLKGAPEWIDRNWVAYADYDPLRGLEPGPALRVPTRGGDEMVYARPGDYVVKQEVVLMHGIEPDVVIEVWAKESFEKNFIPNRSPDPMSNQPQRQARGRAFDVA